MEEISTLRKQVADIQGSFAQIQDSLRIKEIQHAAIETYLREQTEQKDKSLTRKEKVTAIIVGGCVMLLNTVTVVHLYVH